MLTSRQNKELRALRSRKGRAESGRFLAEGVRVVEDLLSSPLTVHWAVCASSLEDSERGRRLTAELETRGLVRGVLADRDFASLAATDTPQGVVAVAEIPERDLGSLDLPDRSVLLVLDAVQDPGNFGTLVRSAEALGAAGVVALPGTVDPWNPKSVRAAAGSSFRIPVAQAPWEEVERFLRDQGIAIFGAAVEGRPVAPLRQGRAAVVVGNEGAGLTREVREAVDEIIGIPLRGRAESLNVAAAAAIILYELTRQR